MIAEKQIADFAKAVEAMRRRYFEHVAPNLAADKKYNHAHVGYSIGRKYARLTTPNGSNLDGSAFCFVDMATGDILKTASWAAPAKGVRGNIANGAADLTPHGARYNK